MSRSGYITEVETGVVGYGSPPLEWQVHLSDGDLDWACEFDDPHDAQECLDDFLAGEFDPWIAESNGR